MSEHANKLDMDEFRKRLRLYLDRKYLMMKIGEALKDCNTYFSEMEKLYDDDDDININNNDDDNNNSDMMIKSSNNNNENNKMQ